MANHILFRWEDSPSLQHHCGFCARSLNHPGAKNSCLGTHAEPCSRFHQALFMRNRAHVCASCIGTDEAHHKRHIEICEKLRPIYEINGEDSSLFPTVDASRDQRDNGRDQDDTRPPDDNDDDRSADSVLVTKKQKKDAKKLARAASRPKVITQAEIDYIGSVIHLSSCAVGDAEGPANFEEMDEIEKHLRYNAHVYNKGVKRQVLKSYARIRDADVDFEVEMDRILNDLKVTDLSKRNTKNRGLQGKSLKSFRTMVAELKALIVEDLLQVKKDELETRMRRAGYLRYANRTSFDILENRYTDKDWRTGERILSPELGPETPDASELVANTTKETDQKENMPPSTDAGADLRHLTQGHRKMGSGGKVEEIVPIRANPLSENPQGQVKPKPAPRKLTLNKLSDEFKMPPSRADRALVTPPSSLTLQKTAFSPLSQPNMWSKKLVLIEQVTKELSPKQPFGTAYTELPIVQEKAKKVNDVVQNSVFTPLVVQPAEPVDKVPDHPPISQKKIKKAEREYKRKEKKAVQRAEAILDPDVDEEDETEAIDSQASNYIQQNDEVDNKCEVLGAILSVNKSEDSPATTIQTKPADVQDKANSSPGIGAFQFPFPPSPPLSELGHPATSRSTSLDLTAAAPPLPPPVTTRDKHTDWSKDMRQFIPDALSNPFLFDEYSCIHREPSTCQFESRGVPDCPFHAPCCAYDPKENQCFLVYPSISIHSKGPFDRLRAEKIFAILNAREDMKNRLMIVDHCVHDWFNRTLTSNEEPQSRPQPLRLAIEYREYNDGAKRGRLMHQESTYRDLYFRNTNFPMQVTTAALNAAQRAAEPMGQESMCYCLGPVPSDKDSDKEVVHCSFKNCKIGRFHKECLRGQGVELVTRWYCANCDLEMEKVGTRLLQELEWEIACRRN